MTPSHFLTALVGASLLAAATFAAVATAQPRAATRLPNGDWSGPPISVDQAWENGVVDYNEFRHSRDFDHYNTTVEGPDKNAPYTKYIDVKEMEFVHQTEFISADRNTNGVIDTETERCLFHRTGEGRRAGGIGFRRADIPRAAREYLKWYETLRNWNGHEDKVGLGEWPRHDKEFYDLKPANRGMMWVDIPGCAFMATAGAAPAPAAPIVPPLAPADSPADPAAKPCTPLTQPEAIKLVLTAWSDGRLTRAEADQLNRARHCQLDTDRNGSVSEAEFIAISLADFDRADRNKDGKLSGSREIGALANPGSPVASGLTRQQAQDLAKLRFAVLDRNPRDGAVAQAEYFAVTGEEFTRGDANKDGTLTPQEATRQANAQATAQTPAS